MINQIPAYGRNCDAIDSRAIEYRSTKQIEVPIYDINTLNKNLIGDTPFGGSNFVTTDEIP
jgi:hypothetical protein